jgi:hypothetical protein
MRKLLNLFRSPRLEQDLDRELRYHLDRRVEDLVRSGLSEAEARRQAAMEFGGVAQVREEVRETWIWRWLDNGMRDLRYAGRTLLRSRGFAATAVLSLALGIGANTAVFSILRALVLRSLPVEDPHRLVLVTIPFVGSSGIAYGNSFSYPYYRGFRDEAVMIEGLLAFGRFLRASPPAAQQSASRRHWFPEITLRCSAFAPRSAPRSRAKTTRNRARAARGVRWW